MATALRDLVEFRGERLFNGAVDISWFHTDPEKSKAASEAFIFHGPKYHGVEQVDVGDSHGHTLIDTASLVRSVLRRCYGFEEQPFTLAIAGYGTGKSHLGLALASLASMPASETAHKIIDDIESEDSKIAEEIRQLQSASQPCLVVALNGMQGFDLGAEITRQIVLALNKNEIDSSALDDMRPRYGQAIKLISLSNQAVTDELLAATNAESTADLIKGLEEQNEQTYRQVYDFFASQGMPIRVITAETVRQVIDIAAKEYCGVGKPFRTLLIIFDEFGKYTEFATTKSQIAGNGALQDLFEAVQANGANACFVGFIQFELNAYVQRIAPEYRNEILRYITRYQSADRLYLSINLETLIASLIDKQQEGLLDEYFDSDQGIKDARRISQKLTAWFPAAKNYNNWKDTERFNTIIRKGCWPLSPYSTWLLYFLTAAGKHLQNRSSLSLLIETFKKYSNLEVPSVAEWSLSPVDLWSEVLKEDLITSEEGGQQGTITHSYSAVVAKHGTKFTDDEHRLLIAVVLASKLGLTVSSKKEVAEALGVLSGLDTNSVHAVIKQLHEEYNVIEWDDSVKSYDILGDAVPRTQFLAYLRQRVSSLYDESGKSKLFAGRASQWCDKLGDLDCDFAEENKITIREWKYQSVTSNLDFLAQNIQLACERSSTAFSIDESRGFVIYTYVGPSSSTEKVASDAYKLLSTNAQIKGSKVLPILIVLLNDNDGHLGQALAENAVIEDMSEQDRAKFGNLAGAHKEKLGKIINDLVDSMIKEKHYITGASPDEKKQRLSQVAKGLFVEIYNSPIAFPFDGFSTLHGNAAETCHELTIELLHNKLDHDRIMAKPVKIKNRANAVLNITWGIFNKDGQISTRPTHKTLRAISEQWDSILEKEKKLPLRKAFEKLCQPPYGANLASAGLFLGVYIAPRFEQLAINIGSRQIAIPKWIEDGIFKGKYINLSLLHDAYLVRTEGTPQEWINLLDEWESAESYLAKTQYLDKALELKRRLPVPPDLVYREQMLSEKAYEATRYLDEFERVMEEASNRIEKGTKSEDAGILAWGVAALKKLWDRMLLQDSLWEAQQIKEVSSFYDRERGTVIRCFPDWLKSQSPSTPSPEGIWDFRQKMINQIGKSLKLIQLDDLFEQVEIHTNKVIERAELFAKARELQRDVNSWLLSHADAIGRGRVKELRELRKIGDEYCKRIQEITSRLKFPGLDKPGLELQHFLNELKRAEDKKMLHGTEVWNTTIRDESDVDKTTIEVDALIDAFSELPNDVQDFQQMREALRLYKKYYIRLSDESLTWDDLKDVAAEMHQECKSKIGDAELPWPYQEVTDIFTVGVTENRKTLSAKWLDKIETALRGISDMPTSEANQLLTQIGKPPAVITTEDLKKSDSFKKIVEIRLNQLLLEWLLEKFSELPKENQIKFLADAKGRMKN